MCWKTYHGIILSKLARLTQVLGTSKVMYLFCAARS